MRARLGTRQGVKEGYDKQAQLSKPGHLFRRARIAPQLLHEDVAMAAGVEVSDIHRLEMGTGETGPTFDAMVRIAHALDMKLVVELAANEPSASAATEDGLREEF